MRKTIVITPAVVEMREVEVKPAVTRTVEVGPGVARLWRTGGRWTPNYSILFDTFDPTYEQHASEPGCRAQVWVPDGVPMQDIIDNLNRR